MGGLLGLRVVKKMVDTVGEESAPFRIPPVQRLVSAGNVSLTDWEVFPLPLSDVGAVPFPPEPQMATARRRLRFNMKAQGSAARESEPYAFYR